MPEIKTLPLLLLTACICSKTFAQASADLTYIENVEREVIAAWLLNQPHLRIATDDDCACAEELQKVRTWGGNPPDYRPYYARGDFNGDRAIDFAVVLYNKPAKRPGLLAIFNGPYRVGDQPAYTSPISDKVIIDFNPQKPVPRYLFVGYLFSEGIHLVPKGNTYVSDDEDEGSR